MPNRVNVHPITCRCNYFGFFVTSMACVWGNNNSWLIRPCRDHISQTLLDANHSLFSGQAQLLFFRRDKAIQREREPLSLKLSKKMNSEKGIQLVTTQRKRVSSQNKCQCNHRLYLFRNKVPMKWKVRSTGQHSTQASRHWYKEC